MATLAANDQENVLRRVQAGATGKSLNASLNAKTPGNKLPKTPFKLSLNDENAANKAVKAGLNANTKGGRVDENAFITPAGVRIRAPLGMKTTNAKSRPFQTPAPGLLSSAKAQKASPRLRRPKVKIHKPETEADGDDDVPEIEYMPPKEVPLEDNMGDDWPKDWNFPQLDHATMAHGIFEAYHNPVEDDGRTRKQREFDEEMDRERKQRDKEFSKVLEAQMAGYEAEARRCFMTDESQAVLKPLKSNGLATKKTSIDISTTRARSAAAALASTSRPSFDMAAGPAVESRHTSRLKVGNKPMRLIPEPSTSRQATALAASKSTIGYAQGRAGRAGPVTRKPLSNVIRPSAFAATARQDPAAAATEHHNMNIRPASLQPRTAPSHSGSSTRNKTHVIPKQEQPYRATEDVEHKMEKLTFSGPDKVAEEGEDEDEDEDAWMKSFRSQLQGDAFDDDLDGFEFQIPKNL